MKLSDVKHIIDEYFDNVDPAEVVRHFEEIGYKFEPINNMENTLDKLSLENKKQKENSEIIGIKTETGNIYYSDYIKKEIEKQQCNIADDRLSVCHCYNTECMHQHGNFCMAAQFNCEDRQNRS